MSTRAAGCCCLNSIFHARPLGRLPVVAVGNSLNSNNPAATTRFARMPEPTVPSECSVSLVFSKNLTATVISMASKDPPASTDRIGLSLILGKQLCGSRDHRKHDQDCDYPGRENVDPARSGPINNLAWNEGVFIKSIYRTHAMVAISNHNLAVGLVSYKK